MSTHNPDDNLYLIFDNHNIIMRTMDSSGFIYSMYQFRVERLICNLDFYDFMYDLCLGLLPKLVNISYNDYKVYMNWHQHMIDHKIKTTPYKNLTYQEILSLDFNIEWSLGDIITIRIGDKMSILTDVELHRIPHNDDQYVIKNLLFNFMIMNPNKEFNIKQINEDCLTHVQHQ